MLDDNDLREIEKRIAKHKVDLFNALAILMITIFVVLFMQGCLQHLK